MNPDLLRGALYGMGFGLAGWSAFAAFFVSWYGLILVAGAVMVIAAGVVGALMPEPYDSTIFGREAAAFDRIVANGGIE